ncbi:Uncharacterised protein [Mycobacteroides abscessus subsp. abscessus]|nr:Uncharacterised protein [Mycobacteroides abscessus subsp. abscessus]
MLPITLSTEVASTARSARDSSGRLSASRERSIA